MTTDHELLIDKLLSPHIEAELLASLRKVIEGLIAEVISLRAGGWQDISTAPKDGSDILILSNGCCVCGYWNSREGAFVTFQYGIDSPTHWMPLPLKPTGEL